jgi:hypothetical protein
MGNWKAIVIDDERQGLKVVVYHKTAKEYSIHSWHLGELGCR